MIFGCKIIDFQKVSPKRIRKTPHGKHKMLQDAPKTAQDAPKTSRDAPKTRPRRHKTAQEHPKTPPRGGPARARSGKNWDRKAISSGTPSKPRFLSVLGWIWEGFWMVLGSCWNRFLMDFTGDLSHAQGSLNLAKPDPVVA